MKLWGKLVLCLSLLALVLGLAACGSDSSSDSDTSAAAETSAADGGSTTDDGAVRSAIVKWPLPSFRKISLRSFWYASVSVLATSR